MADEFGTDSPKLFFVAFVSAAGSWEQPTSDNPTGSLRAKAMSHTLAIFEVRKEALPPTE